MKIELLNKTSEEIASEIMWKFYSNENLSHMADITRLQFAATQSLISLEGQIKEESDELAKIKLNEVINLIKGV